MAVKKALGVVPPYLIQPAKVLLLENIHSVAEQALVAAGYEVELLKGALNEVELIARLQDVAMLGIRSATNITDRVLSHAPQLIGIGAFCIGTNQIDRTAAANRGIAVFNAPFQNTRSVVELAIAEIIALKRQLLEKNSKTHAGIWDKSAQGSHEVRSLVLGIVGYGRIGSQLSVVAENLGMHVQYYDITDTLSMSNATRCDSFRELLATSDIVTVHVDGRPENKGLFGDTEFKLMRDGSLFLNLSRGMVVDIVALKHNLLSGHLAGAAVDVFPQEPKVKGEAFVSELQNIPNVILTPHVAGSTEEAQESIGDYVSGKLIDYAGLGTTSMSVSLPTIKLTRAVGAYRLTVVHKNVPGVLAELNTILSGGNANIMAQNLGTMGDIGYVITDSSTEYSNEVARQVVGLATTIRMRIVNELIQ
jgi:D-3-phosphoglycerate dehydrogenase